MPYANNFGTAIYYETVGPDDGPTIILIEGFSMQLVGWRRGFVDALVRRGLRVVLVDNRDVGLSQKTGGPEEVVGTYSIADMGDDVIAVADALGAQHVHLAGQSMGGLVVQRAFLRHPERVLSAVLFYTGPGNPEPYLKPGTDEVDDLGLDEATNREEAIELSVLRARGIESSPAYEFEEDWFRELAAIGYDRCYDPAGVRRQYSAVLNENDSYLPLLGGNPMPVAIIQGRADPIVRDEAAFDLYNALPNAELHFYPGMGHLIVPPLFEPFADIIARTVERGIRAGAAVSPHSR